MANKSSLTIPANKSLFAVTVQTKDLPEFFKLCDKNQRRIKILLEAFDTIVRAPTLSIGYQRAADEIQAGVKINAEGIAIPLEWPASDKRGTSPARLRSYFDEFRGGRDWRCLIDRALEWSPVTKMPQEFLDYVQEQVNLNKRSVETALKKIRARWTAGQSIPGYGTWQEHFQRTHPGRRLPAHCREHPLGWTTRNLRKKLDTSKFRRKAIVEGRQAAAKLRPLVLSTRAGLYAGSHYMWDDVWHDNFVNSLAERKMGRPLELFCHDYFSARKVRYGIRVRTEDDNGKMQGLTARMMRMIYAATYFLDGYSPRGTINVAEHGTAAVDEHMERTLYDHSGGLITVERSPMLGDAAHCGQYNGRRTGNWRFKASLESSNNIVHNLLADVPGQTGPDRKRRPEELGDRHVGLLHYNSRLLAAMQSLSPARAELLRFPLLEINQFLPVLADVYRFLEEDHEHDLEGWAACGHYTQEVHLMGEWRTMEELSFLPERQREIAAAMIAGGHCETRPRKLSRREVWDKGCGDFIKIHGGTVCELLGEDFAQEREVRSHQFAFHDQEVGPEEHRFEGIITDMEGRVFALKEKEKYLAFINPFAPNHLLVKDAGGRFLGIAKRCTKVTRGDTEALHKAMGRASHIESELLKPLERQTARENRKRLEMHQHNAALISEEAAEREDLTDAASLALTKAVRQQAFQEAVLAGGGDDDHDISTNNNISNEDSHEIDTW